MEVNTQEFSMEKLRQRKRIVQDQVVSYGDQEVLAALASFLNNN